MDQLPLPWELERRVFTVSELNWALRGLLEREFSNIWVSGEISGVRQASSGHCYFSLKDETAQVRCVCFRSAVRFLRFKPQDGLSVIARGRLDVFEARGEYQLLVEALEPQGYGALQLAFEQLKKKLAAEGMFDPSRKRSIPRHPRRIGIITSPDGAVLRDMLQILSRRFPGLHIRIWPTPVQGFGSVDGVCAGLEYFSKSAWPQVVIVARGGGSLEDLWTFNEEAVARAIGNSAVPVLSAIGHETDFTIADFAADLRAPTPSAAAELVICTRQELLDQLATQERNLRQAIRFRLVTAARRLHQQAIDRTASVLARLIGKRYQRLDEMNRRIQARAREKLGTLQSKLAAFETRLRRTDLRLRLSETRRRLDILEASAVEALRRRLDRSRRRLEPLAAQLVHLSPLNVLERGYAIVQNEAGSIVRGPEDAPAGTRLRVRVVKGEFAARAEPAGPTRADSSEPPS
jgi:exodeoxyribonuclease VII large subunit